MAEGRNWILTAEPGANKVIVGADVTLCSQMKGISCEVIMIVKVAA